MCMMKMFFFYTYEIWLNCGNDENIVFKPMKFDWIVEMMKCWCETHEIWLNCVNNENAVVKPMKFDWIVRMMKMMMLNPRNLIELWE